MKFELNKKQEAKLNKWLKEQKDTYAGAAGGSLTYEFTPTGLGEIVSVKCVNGNELNLTDWDGF